MANQGRNEVNPEITRMASNQDVFFDAARESLKEARRQLEKAESELSKVAMYQNQIWDAISAERPPR